MVESSQSLTRPDPGRNLTAPGYRSLDTQTKDYIRMSELQLEIRTKSTEVESAICIQFIGKIGNPLKINFPESNS